MDPSDYRRDYAAYRSSVERALYERRAGLSARLELRPVEERYAGRRRELARRWLDASAACDDLRAARLEALGEAARGLGFEGRAALYESFAGAAPVALAAAADSFLRRTESAYMSRLAGWAARE